jgi:endonuclease YncB( thermonuclease family)
MGYRVWGMPGVARCVDLMATSVLLAPLAEAQSPPHTPYPIPTFSPDSGPRNPIRATRDCIVVRIIDGDTFNCKDLGNVRMTGIDAPERDQTPMGAASTSALKALLPVGKTVQLEGDVGARDRNSRILAYVWANGRMVNWVMVRSGWTATLTVPPNVQYVDALKTAQTKARDERLGLWKTDGFSCLPADHRQKKC